MAKTIPEVDEKRLETVQKKVTGTAVAIMGITIKSDQDMTYASELLSQANKHADMVKADKEKLTKPLNAVLKNIRDRYKPVETELEKAIKHLRKEIGAYQTRKDEEAEKERARIAARVGPGRGKLGIETASKQIAEVTGPEKMVETASGSISFRDDYEITILNIREIPEQFLEVDEAGIKKALKAGGTVAGIAAKKIKVPINRRS